jgi:site-specific recombinase XerD
MYRRAFFSETVGIAGVRPYDGTRHLFARQLANKGKSIEIIGEILGTLYMGNTKGFVPIS